jgi:hypothetical protein
MPKPRALLFTAALLCISIAGADARSAPFDVLRCVQGDSEVFASRSEAAEYRRLGFRCKTHFSLNEGGSGSDLGSFIRANGGSDSGGGAPVRRAAPTFAPRSVESPQAVANAIRSESTAAPASDGALPFDDIVAEAAATYSIPPEIIHAIIRVESNYRPDAVSHAGARGLMQLMPATAARLEVADPFNPRDNVMGGTRYLRKLANYFDGDIIKVIAAYHAGHVPVVELDRIPYAQTVSYVKRVLGHAWRLKGERSAAQANVSAPTKGAANP